MRTHLFSNHENYGTFSKGTEQESANILFAVTKERRSAKITFTDSETAKGAYNILSILARDLDSPHSYTMKLEPGENHIIITPIEGVTLQDAAEQCRVDLIRNGAIEEKERELRSVNGNGFHR